MSFETPATCKSVEHNPSGQCHLGNGIPAASYVVGGATPSRGRPSPDGSPETRGMRPQPVEVQERAFSSYLVDETQSFSARFRVARNAQDRIREPCPIRSGNTCRSTGDGARRDSHGTPASKAQNPQKWYTVFRSLIASCALHDINPQLYLEQVLRLAPHWPVTRTLELAPKYWKATLAALDDKQQLIITPPWELDDQVVSSDSDDVAA